MLSATKISPRFPDIDALPPSAYLTGAQVGALSGYADVTVRLWRRQGRGPRVTLVEGRPRYRVSDVRIWLQAS